MEVINSVIHHRRSSKTRAEKNSLILEIRRLVVLKRGWRGWDPGVQVA